MNSKDIDQLNELFKSSFVDLQRSSETALQQVLQDANERISKQLKETEAECAKQVADTEAKCAEMLNETKARIVQELAEAKAEQQVWEEEKKLIAGTYELKMKGDRVSLDLRGHLYSTKLSTFSSDIAQGTMLQALFSGRHELDQQENGAVFLDRDPIPFRYILNYLVSPSTFCPPPTAVECKQLVYEAQYYAMPREFFGCEVQDELIERCVDAKEVKVTSNAANSSEEQLRKLLNDGYNSQISWGESVKLNDSSPGHLTFTFTSSISLSAVQVKRGYIQTFDIQYQDSKNLWHTVQTMTLNNPTWNPKVSWSPREAKVWRLNLKGKGSGNFLHCIRLFVARDFRKKFFQPHSWCKDYVNSKGEIII